MSTQLVLERMPKEQGHPCLPAEVLFRYFPESSSVKFLKSFELIGISNANF